MGAPSTRLRIRVSAGARRAGIAGRLGDSWKLRVSTPAEGGRANAAVVRLLAKTVGVPARRVALVSGHGARDKVVAVEGVDHAEVERRLEGASA
jgi:uncharacterized protein